MPIRLPRDFKGFQKRKSSTNALEDVQKDAEPSFRVIARPQSLGNSLDSGRAFHHLVSKPIPPGPNYDADDDLFSAVKNDVANRGSGGTANSLSTGQYDSAGSSRLSSSSTIPSSVDARSDKNVTSPPHRPYDNPNLPPPPPHSSKPSFLRNAGRAMSFGINRDKYKDLPSDVPASALQQARHEPLARERAMTVSSITTAAPPRLVEDFSTSKEDEDDFGNMFARIGAKASRTPSPMRFPAQSSRTVPSTLDQPTYHNPASPTEGVPYSFVVHPSRTGPVRSPSPTKTAMQDTPRASRFRDRNAPQRTVSAFTNDDNMFEDTPLSKADNISSRPQFSSPAHTPPSSYPTARSRAPSSATAHAQSPQSVSSEFSVPPIDPAFLESAQLATQYRDQPKSPPVPQTHKVMTPAEFERYKQQKEETRKYNKVFGKTNSDDGSADEYEDDEEDDRDRERAAVKQRKKQEAHLAVYRQQMKKVTGETPNAELSRPGTNPSGLMERRMSSMTLDHKSVLGVENLVASPDGDDEDEDVPLGILAAHGFPNKNRPPAKLTTGGSNPNLRQLAQTPGAASVVGEGARGPLPAFARNLPADPYYGAGIVNPSYRESLAIYPNSSQHLLATQPQASGASTQHPLHPAGLVGVIAGEERARAMRRGSPNAQGGYDLPPGMGSQRPSMPPHMSSYGMPASASMQLPPSMAPPMLTPGEQAQLHMAGSMQQMMQMQMQWMQQMASMMNGQGPPGPTMNPSMMPPPVTTAPPRPRSTPLQSFGGLSNSRTMSSLSPALAPWNQSSMTVPQLGTQYAQSIAPSERSNVGLSARYRPVSTMMPDPNVSTWQKRSSTFTASTLKPWGHENGTHQRASTIRAVPRPVDDEDDDEGWAQMKAKKDQKKKSWKLRRGKEALGELVNS